MDSSNVVGRQVGQFLGPMPGGGALWRPAEGQEDHVHAPLVSEGLPVALERHF